MAKTKEVKKTPRVTKEKKEAAPKKQYAFHVEISSSGVTYKADGDVLHKILRDFPAPALINTETNILVTKDGKTIQRDLKVADARRCFTGFDTTSLELLAIAITKQLP